MLVVTRKEGQRVRIGEAVVILLETKKGHAKLGIIAPESVKILREELPPRDSEVSQR